MQCLFDAALSEPTPAPVSRLFGDYQIEAEIARGGMGIVYRARQLSLKRPVALKMIAAGELADAETLRRFQHEAEAAARLRHPNIVAVYEIRECDEEHYIAMELVEGQNLLEDQQRGAIATAKIIAKVARALAFAHEHGVLHRDVKPSNIMLDKDGEPRLMDFGIAKIMGGESVPTLTDTALGSPSYMAPEQAAKGEITTATDVYGLGAVLYHLLARKPPFKVATAFETMRLVMDGAPEKLPSSVPRDLATICLKCLEKSPAARYRSALELAEDCERFIRGEIISARPVLPPELLIRWMCRHPRSAALLAFTLLTILAGVGGIFWQWRNTQHAVSEQAKVLKHLRWQRINDWLEDGDPARALAFLAKDLREQPDHWQAAMYAMSIIDQHAFPLSAGPEILPASKTTQPACIAPAGDWVAAACADKTVRAWDIASGKEIVSIAHDAAISALALGSKIALAIASEDGALTLHESLTAKATPVARSDASPVQGLAFSADGTRLLARCKDHVELHEIGAAPTSLKLDEISGAALSATGQRVLAWSKKSAVVWDATSGKELLRVAASNSFHNGALSANGQRITLVDGNDRARSWDVDSQNALPLITQPLSAWRTVTLNHEGTRVTVTGTKSELTVFDLESGLQVSPKMSHHYMVQNLVGSADGRLTASNSDDGAVHIWDAISGQTRMSPLWVGQPRQNGSVKLNANGSTILVHIQAFAELPESLTAWHTTSVRTSTRKVIAGSSNFDLCRLSPDGRLGCMGLLPKPRAYVYELATDKVLLDKPVAGGVYDFEFSPAGDRCYVLTANGWLYGWDLQSGEELWKPSQQPGKVRPATITADGTRIIAGHNDGHIRVYDTATGTLVLTLDHPGEIKSLRLAPDHSGRLVSSGTDNLARVWDLKSGHLLQTFVGHTGVILSTAWSHDSKLIATASYDSTARVWDVATGQTISPPMKHGAWLSHLEFSPDGKVLATACRDGTGRLFDPHTSQPLCEPIQQGNSLEAVRFTADGKALFVRDLTGFRFYDAVTGETVTQHYHDPSFIGIGFDSESVRSMINRDGTKVFLGSSMDDAGLWTLEQPRGSVPSWFPDLLETLAVMRFDEQGIAMPISGAKIASVKQRIAKSGDKDYTHWAKRLLGL